MRGHQLQGEAFAGQLLQSHFTGLVAVAPRAFDGDVFQRHFADGKVGEVGHLALHQQRAAFALERFNAQHHCKSAGARSAVQRHINALARRDFQDARQRVFGVDVDDVIGPQLQGHFEPLGVFAGAGDDDELGPSLFAGHHLRQTLLPRPLDEHAAGVAHVAVHQCPLDAIGHGRDDTGDLGADPSRHFVQH